VPELENALVQGGQERRPVGDGSAHDVDDEEALVEKRFEPTDVAGGEGGEELIVGLLWGDVIAHGALQCPGSVEPLHLPIASTRVMQPPGSGLTMSDESSTRGPR
jgi:hypothetical protein